MLSRRIFIQGTAAVFGGLVPALQALRAQAGAPSVTAIDSTETPFFRPAPGIRHIRLSGSQLHRFQTLRDLFASEPAMQVQVHLDDSAQVLLESALLAAGKSVGDDAIHFVPSA